MKVIILSAGQGKRLLPHTESCPMCALPLGDRPALEWQLDALTVAGATEVVVVTGFCADVIESCVASYRGVPVRTVHNPFYAHSDNLGTCWTVRHEMTGPFVILNGDTMFEAGVFGRLLASPPVRPITLVTNTKERYDADDMKVITEGDTLLRVGKQLPVDTVTGESIGMIRFDATGAALFRTQLEQIMRTDAGLKRWYLSVIDELAAQGHVGVVSTGTFDWCEIDSPEDLRYASRVVPAWWGDAAQAAAAQG